MARQVGLREVYQESCKSKATQISRVAFVVAETSVDKVHYTIGLHEGSRGYSWQQTSASEAPIV